MTRQIAYPLLVIDAGNSAVKFAIVARAGGSPKLVNSVPTAKLAVAAARRIGAKAKSAAISSVVPAASRILRKAFPQARFIDRKTVPGFKTLADRKTIGSDRLANVAAARARHGRNVIVVSFGTAATFDIIDAKGVHRGGAIAPGWRTFAGILPAKTALLRGIEVESAARFVGRNTREAMASGVTGGYAAMTEALIAGMKKEAGIKNARLVFTGGDAADVAMMVGLKAITDPLLTLRGIALLWACNAREGRK